MDMDDANESESVARFYSNFEGDFEQTISLLEMNVDEVEIEVQQSFEEVSKHVGGLVRVRRLLTILYQWKLSLI